MQLTIVFLVVFSSIYVLASSVLGEMVVDSISRTKKPNSALVDEITNKAKRKAFNAPDYALKMSDKEEEMISNLSDNVISAVFHKNSNPKLQSRSGNRRIFIEKFGEDYLDVNDLKG